MIRNRSRRGALLYGIAAIVVVVSMMTGLVLLRSTEVYRDAAVAKYRMQALAAAEGAAIVLEATDLRLSEPLTIGHTRVAADEPLTDASASTVALHVDVLGKTGAVLLTQEYVAHFNPAAKEGGQWMLAGISKP